MSSTTAPSPDVSPPGDEPWPDRDRAARELAGVYPQHKVVKRLKRFLGSDTEDPGVLTEMVACAYRLQSNLDGLQAEILQRLQAAHHSSGLGEELAARLSLTTAGADRLLNRAAALDDYVEVHFALLGAEIDARKADVFIDATKTLPTAQARAIHRALLPEAPNLTTGQLRHRLRAAALAVDADLAQDRHEAAAKDRSVSLDPADDEMAFLTFYLPATDAMAAMTTLDALAVKNRPNDERSVGARRADAFMDLIHQAMATGRTPDGSPVPTQHRKRPHLVITVAQSTLDGEDDAPGYLAGYGPLSAEIIRGLARAEGAGAGEDDDGAGADEEGAGDDGGDAGAEAGGRNDDDGAGAGDDGSAGDDGEAARDDATDDGGAEPDNGANRDADETSAGAGASDRPDNSAVGAGTSTNGTTENASRHATGPAGTTSGGHCGSSGTDRRAAPQPVTPGAPSERVGTDAFTGTLLPPPPSPGGPGGPDDCASADPFIRALRLCAGSDPVTALAGVGILATDAYQPGAALRSYILTRDVTCRFPTCRQPARRCQIDHIIPFDPDRPAWTQTHQENLHLLCQRHHQLKTAGIWSVTRDHLTGDTHWTSPLGYRYTRPTEVIDPTHHLRGLHRALEAVRAEHADEPDLIGSHAPVQPGLVSDAELAELLCRVPGHDKPDQCTCAEQATTIEGILQRFALAPARARGDDSRTADPPPY